MVDTRTKEQRSALMSRIGGKNTAPEIKVRKLLHSLGYRFSLHRKNLPGTPDIVLRRYARIIMVNGCFWHGHSCRRGRLPSSREEFWAKKIAMNKLRDARNLRQLRALGWKALTVWECEISAVEKLERKLIGFLENDR